MTEPIPGPRGVPVLGNVFDLDAADPLGGFVRHGRGVRADLQDQHARAAMRLLVSGPELVDEICDDTRFDKKIGGGLASCSRAPAGSGLFTAETDDPLWARAHNILMAPFSLQAMRDYMPDDARHRRPADGQVGAAQPGRGGRRRRRT